MGPIDPPRTGRRTVSANIGLSTTPAARHAAVGRISGWAYQIGLCANNGRGGIVICVGDRRPNERGPGHESTRAPVILCSRSTREHKKERHEEDTKKKELRTSGRC